MLIKMFHALHPTSENASQIAVPPYDVVSREEARHIAADNPLSFFHVTRADIHLSIPQDQPSGETYRLAHESFRKLIAGNHLVKDVLPGIYIYREIAKQNQQIGIIALCHIDDYEHNLIKKHEKTLPQKEEDRFILNKTLRANTDPIFLMYKDNPDIHALIAQGIQGPTLFDFKDPDGVQHTGWRLADTITESMISAFKEVASFYIADGHHRAASAVRTGIELRNKNPNHTGDEPYNWFLTALFPESQLAILPYNRTLQGLEDRSPDALIALFKSHSIEVNPIEKPFELLPKGTAMLYFKNQWYFFKLPCDEKEGESLAESIDASRLQRYVLKPIFNIDDPRSDPRIDFVGGVHGHQGLMKLVASGKASAAIALPPVTAREIMTVSDHGEIMPPKSTWFEPKLRSGLFVYTF